MNDLFFDKEIDSGSTCGAGHPIRLVAEGYGYCIEDSAGSLSGSTHGDLARHPPAPPC